MPTDTPPSRRPAASGARQAAGFALRLTAWSLGLFGLFRLPWVEAHVFLPATRLQAAAGAAVVGPSSIPIEVTLACSGADALALCFAAILAYPARWRMRAAGVAGSAAIILALNTIRIGTLGRAAASPWWFNALHVYIWPAILALTIAGLVWSWMRMADRQRADRAPAAGRDAVSSEREPRLEGAVTLRFGLIAAAFLVIFTLASPWYLESARLLAVANMVAGAAAVLLGFLGMTATASAGVLATPRGAFLVTQECIATPLIPIYLAAVLVYVRTWPSRALWVAAGVPLFIALGIARLLVVALPAGLSAPPAFYIHAFTQFLVGAGMVGGLALWRHGARPATLARAAAALAVAVVFVQLIGAPYTRAILAFTPAAAAVDDPQGAFMLLPAFQLGLFVALWIAAFVSSGWTRFLAGATLLVIIQVGVAGGVELLAAEAGVAPLVRDIRAWALLGPALIIAAVVNVARPRR